MTSILALPTASVLLIDDDQDYGSLLSRYLRKATDWHYEATVVANGDAAEQACHRIRFDCLLVDYHLVEYTGVQLVARLRQNVKSGLGPVIIMTADGGYEAGVDAMTSGATRFLTKGEISRESLCRDVSYTLQSHSPTGTARRSALRN